jgi:uncharacterized membrane protein
MKVRHFLSALEHDRIHQTIRSAEDGTSGNIVVFITHRHIEDPLAAATEKFGDLRLGSAKEDNSLLIFVAPKSQKFAVVGGKALHEKVGQTWWNELSELLTRRFKQGLFTDGLIAAIDRAGHALKSHFPATATDRAGQSDIVEE